MMKAQYTMEADGFRATWFEGTTHRDKAVIYLGGAKMGEALTIESSAYVRSVGYSVLVLGFYLWEGLPKEMYRIPVEYAERAVAELRRNGFEQIAIYGTSTGAGYALLCASLIRQISCVIAVSPYDYVMEGMKNDLFPLGLAVYSHGGESLPYSRYMLVKDGLLHALKQFMKIRKEKGYRLAHVMRYAYDTSEETEASRIKVENMHAELLLMAPLTDDCWPSEQAVPRMERILREKGYPYRVKAVIYEKASHFLGMDSGVLLKNRVMKQLIGVAMPAEQKYPRECEQARQDSQQQVLAFLEDWTITA